MAYHQADPMPTLEDTTKLMRFQRKLIYLILCLPFILSACSMHKLTSDEQNELYTLPGLNHGLLQSPINILSFKEETAKNHKITLHFQDNIETISNIGDVVQLNFSEGSVISFRGLTYNFKQIHFHTPSEHFIDGITFPMEMHVVTNKPSKNKNNIPRYLVIAFLFKMGEASQFIDDFLNLIPSTGNSVTSIKPGTVKLRDLFYGTEQREIENFYHYRGSLTTPPYTETVEWFVFKNILEASPEQIKSINLIKGDNARRIQGTFGRSIH